MLKGSHKHEAQASVCVVIMTGPLRAWNRLTRLRFVLVWKTWTFPSRGQPASRKKDAAPATQL